MRLLGSAALAFAFLALLSISPLTAEERGETEELERIIEKMDDLYRSRSSYSEIEMVIETPNWQRTLAMKAWTHGTDRTFIRITSPRKEKDVATLRIENEMWNYLPKVNKVIKVPPSMMMSSWMGSDFTNDDLVKEFLLHRDYTCRFVAPEEAAAENVYIECVPRENLPVVWGKIIAAVRRGDDIPVWQKFYDENDELMRVLNFEEVKDLGGRTVPTVMEMIPLSKEGHKTIVRYLSAEFDADIDEDVFTLRNLRSQ